MRKMIKSGSKLFCLAFTVFALCFLMSGDAWAEGGSHYSTCAKDNIFATMRCMVAYTLYDLRYIIYIVGALGLITFAFGAIFGKISFKHLANICFSLFLVSMLSPFVRYFSGTDVLELNYDTYLPENNQDVDDNSKLEENGGDVTGGGTAGAANEALGGGSGGSSRSGVNRARGTSGGGSGGSSDDEEIKPLDIADVNSKAYSFDDIGGATSKVAGLDVADLTPLGSNEDSSEKKLTTWQKLKKTVKDVKNKTGKLVTQGTAIYAAAKNIKGAIERSVDAVGNAEGIGGIAAAGQAVFDNGGTVVDNLIMVSSDTKKAAKIFQRTKQGLGEGEEVSSDAAQANTNVKGGVNLLQQIFKGEGF